MKISVVTVCYNSHATLSHTLDSIFRQSHQDIEVVIKDGGSTDGTIDIIKQYEGKFGPRLRWISEKDEGIYDAMSKGVELATGDVIGILNSDDFFSSDKSLEVINDTFEKKNVDAVYGDVHFVREENLDKSVRYYSAKLFRPMFMRFGFMPPHLAFYLKKSVYDKIGAYKKDYQISGDFELMVRAFLKFHVSYAYIPCDLVTMRTGGASTKNWKGRLVGLREDVRACRENGIYTNLLLSSAKYAYKALGFVKKK